MHPDRITANLPSRDFDATVAFYGLLGFSVLYRDAAWLILSRGTMELEFVAHPDLVPAESWHSACIRVEDLAGLHRDWSGLDLGRDPMGRARDMRMIDQGVHYFALIDCDGSLLRCIDNGSV